MGEYQFYEFAAIDSPLTNEQMQELRRYSSRATITARRFQNVYNFGDFGGNPEHFLTHFFDVMVYLAHWGTSRLMFTLPAPSSDLVNQIRPYESETLSVTPKDDRLIVNIGWDGGDFRTDSGEGYLDWLAELRTEWLSGDFRSAYLAWLLSVQYEQVDENQEEPPVPAGLNELTEAQQGLVKFLQLDQDLVNAAASASGSRQVDGSDLRRWIASQPSAQKDEWLFQVVCDHSTYAAGEIRRKWLEEASAQTTVDPTMRRRVSEIVTLQQEYTERREAEEAREAARRHAEKLERLANDRDALWRKVFDLATQRSSVAFNHATEILEDLWELARHEERESAFREHVQSLCDQKRFTPALIRRIKKSGMLD